MSSTDNHNFQEPRTAFHVTELPTVALATLGCKTNQFESACMQEMLQKAGYRIIPFEEGADLVIVNTCTVTSATDAQSRNLIRRARRLNDTCRVIVTGCYAQISPDDVQVLPGVSIVIGNEEKQRLLDFLGMSETLTHVSVADISEAQNVCLSPMTSFAGHSRAFVQIQNGCNAFCSYCIIPYARGASRSTPANDILFRVGELVDAGYPEIVLTGIHIGGYGIDLQPPLTLNKLVRLIERDTATRRLRLGSIEPTEMSDELLATVAASRVVCPHLHIPLQSGDDRVLKRMGRNYDTQFFARLIDKVRTALPSAAISMDVITGFPGETEQEFAGTYDFIANLPITDLHVFPYSRRPGTPAASLPDQVPASVSRSRAEKLRMLAAEKYRCFAESFIGRELDVVVETLPKGGLLKGISGNYLDIRFSGEATLAGKIALVRPTSWQNSALRGEFVS